MKSVAIITARGGSKRIPKKNIREFCGKPIISYSIEAALTSGVFDEVMVSTDSKEIADISMKYGAKVPFFRSDKNSSDYATTADVLTEVIDEYQKRGMEFEYMACIYPTAPFITAEKLKRGMEMLTEGCTKMVMPVVKFSYPPQRGYIMEEGVLNMKNIENASKRSQDLESMYHDAGQFYLVKMKNFFEENGQIFEGIKPIILSELEVQDIDNETDWKIAELKYKMMIGGM